MSNKLSRGEQADQSHAAPSDGGVTLSVSDRHQFDRRHDDTEHMYKLRNGKGEFLPTPKRSSVARAKALLTTPPRAPPCRLTITGSEWPVASMVSSDLHKALISPDDTFVRKY